MKIINCKQGEPGWLLARAGLVTASRFEVLMTKDAMKGKLTTGSRTYLHEKLAEWIDPQAVVDGDRLGGFVARGTELEPEALAYYEFDRGATIVPVGFITLDDGSAGCSPDGLCGPDGMVEAKCYSLTHHIAALLESDESHAAQCQGNLWITERQWVDRVYYSPILPPVIVRIKRDEEYIATLAASVAAFNEHLEEAKAKLIALGVTPKTFQAVHENMQQRAAEDAEFDQLVEESKGITNVRTD